MGFSKLFKDFKSRKAASNNKHNNNANETKSSQQQVQNNNKNNNLPKRQSKKRSADFNLSNEKVSKRNRPAKRKNQGRPSEAALSLSTRLKELSQQKRLQEALDFFWDKAHDEIRDEHHACIVVDCCSRCGDVQEGENVVEKLRQAGKHINVETKTALLKGFAHSGESFKAEALFEEMCNAKGKRDRPNVRTINTLLRGCLWSAITVDASGKSAGGVVTSEKAWSNYQKINQTAAIGNYMDISSFEYSISLLCNALMINKAKERIQAMKEAFSIHDENDDNSIMESFALSYLAIARAYILLGQKEHALEACQYALASSKGQVPNSNGTTTTADNKKLSSATNQYAKNGGKRAWRNENANKDSRRSESNKLFRAHRLSELATDATTMIEYCQSTRQQSKSFNGKELPKRMLTRLFYFSGGGSTNLDVVQTKKNNNNKATKNNDNTATHNLTPGLLAKRQVINALYYSFGLKEALKQANIHVDIPDNKVDTLNKRYCNKILDAVNVDVGGIIAKDGFINFANIFTGGKQKHPLDIELGSGFGEWIVGQARCNPDRNYVAVELRADRVAQIFAKSTTTIAPPLDNICVVGSECGRFLSHHVLPSSVSTIFVNHPEPPTQTFGAADHNIQGIMNSDNNEFVEPAHMLNSTTLITAIKCLQPSGKIVIVTDNKWYGRLLCATFVKVQQQIIKTESISCCFPDGLTEIESFPSFVNKKVVLLQGQPSDTVWKNPSTKNGNGSSYFDRLWRTGAGGHAEQKIRYLIVMQKKIK